MIYVIGALIVGFIVGAVVSFYRSHDGRVRQQRERAGDNPKDWTKVVNK